MISRKALRFPFPKRQIQKAESDAQAGIITPETSQKIINFYKTRYYRQQTLQPGEGDPKLANAIIELAKGPGAVKVPTDTVGLHFDFAKAQYGGHMGARKFALLNLPRMKFYNPRLDIKVFRRPWMGKAVQKTYPCAAIILKADGEKEVIEMRGKRSGKIYDEIMERIGAIDLNGKFAMAKEKAETIVKPHLKWV